jgi:hypothetical protein
MLLAKFVQNICGIETSIRAKLPWDDLQRLRKCLDVHLGLAGVRQSVLAESFADLKYEGGGIGHRHQ